MIFALVVSIIVSTILIFLIILTLLRGKTMENSELCFIFILFMMFLTMSHVCWVKYFQGIPSDERQLFSSQVYTVLWICQPDPSEQLYIVKLDDNRVYQFSKLPSSRVFRYDRGKENPFITLPNDDLIIAPALIPSATGASE
ncbi:MAG: hypothetical protein Q8Q23_04480 [bacterium]|nr:hypothetical protein [bacterium]